MTAAVPPAAEELLEIEAIRQLKHRYFRTLDLKQWEEFAECLVPEATGDYDGLVFEDRAALVAFMAENMGPGLISLHQAHHPEITVDGDRATGIWYLHDQVHVPEHHFSLEGAAFYSDRYVRTDAGWRIEHTGYRRTFEVSRSTAGIPGWKLKKGTAYDA